MIFLCDKMPPEKEEAKHCFWLRNVFFFIFFLRHNISRISRIQCIVSFSDTHFCTLVYSPVWFYIYGLLLLLKFNEPWKPSILLLYTQAYITFVDLGAFYAPSTPTAQKSLAGVYTLYKYPDLYPCIETSIHCKNTWFTHFSCRSNYIFLPLWNHWNVSFKIFFECVFHSAFSFLKHRSLKKSLYGIKRIVSGDVPLYFRFKHTNWVNKLKWFGEFCLFCENILSQSLIIVCPLSQRLQWKESSYLSTTLFNSYF